MVTAPLRATNSDYGVSMLENKDGDSADEREVETDRLDNEDDDMSGAQERKKEKKNRNWRMDYAPCEPVLWSQDAVKAEWPGRVVTRSRKRLTVQPFGLPPPSILVKNNKEIRKWESTAALDVYRGVKKEKQADLLQAFVEAELFYKNSGSTRYYGEFKDAVRCLKKHQESPER
ncbi:hypothetical protein QAD02_017443 [Eretmocerus hayati]|uniref:Uncharacterized protein n=1 Tax=Eretmocerus hayati TaxID=131215 RepID=A0ACC2PDW1_9HYME|nr:hypothetical protein QAD02_017443 [Eretmocerus hayati]